MSGWFRALFLFSSFGPLYAVLAISLHVQSLHKEAQISWGVTALSFLVFMFLKSGFKRKSVHYSRVTSEASLDENILSYMLAYLPPLLIDDFTQNQKVIPAVAFYAVISFLLARIDALYINPYFLLFGFRIYRVRLESQRAALVITKLSEIGVGQRLGLYEIQRSRLYFAEVPVEARS